MKSATLLSPLTRWVVSVHADLDIAPCTIGLVSSLTIRRRTASYRASVSEAAMLPYLTAN